MTIADPDILFDEILDFLTSVAAPEQIVAFQPSEALQARASSLLDRQRNNALTKEEFAELEEIARLNHFMSMLKVRAHKKLSRA